MAEKHKRLAALIRKGRMFEWLEREDRRRRGSIWEASSVGVSITESIKLARNWWKGRKK